MSTPWWKYPLGPGFGGLGGAEHGQDVSTPLDAPITALRGGVITSIQSLRNGNAVGWGNAITWKLDSPVNGVPYMYQIHLDALNPGLQVGSHINAGDLIGYSGGAIPQTFAANQASSPYSLPAGLQHYLDNPVYSTGAHTEFGLSYGPQFATGLGWLNPAQYPNLNPINVLGTGGPTGTPNNTGSPCKPTDIACIINNAIGNQGVLTGGGLFASNTQQSPTQCPPWDIQCTLQQLATSDWFERGALLTVGIILALIGIIVLFVGHGGEVAKKAVP